ncbi:hypothetical protein OSB04_024466 [Centaurea solstitialis]|uniref:TTF-type domain-containing protein n=1 Tax=Centaurea solstitialis TaxID=347529 RepID=A0AA38WC36_9ASTR|nr:hypothetical protein OSB04_024466 [Centaurea solstitialis]
MKSQPTIHSFFKGKVASSSSQSKEPEETTNVDNIAASSVPATDNPCKKARIESNDIDLSTLERDPGLRSQIYDYPINQQDTVRRAYMNLGPLQPTLSMFPKSGPETHKRSFQASWFKLYPWIEYSKTLDAAFCFPCFLFNKPSGPGYYGQKAFTIDGFRNWKKVGGKKCVLLTHMGTECTSFHNVAQKGWDDLVNEAQDIRNIYEKFTTEEREKNRLRLRASIYAVRWCAFQAVGFRGRNEKPDSINRGNFLEMLEALGEFSTELKELFCRAPKYASYTSPVIQKEILNLISNRVRRMISEEIGGRKFCLLVDEARDESHKEQMSSIRGQGYDGASNMRGQFKGLQALILEDCKYAYYVHCLAHRLQLALMAACQGVAALRKFFSQLTFVVNVVSASSKRTDQLRDAQVDQIAYLISIDELETGRGLNQIGTLQRAGDTRWSSHLRSVSSLIKMFSPTCEVLLKIADEGTGPLKVDADSAYEAMTTFEFIFVLHFEKEIMEITDLLCQALQRQNQDIFNALRLVASTKKLLQKMKDEKWDDLLCLVKSFCQVRNIDIPDMSSSYFSRGARSRNKHSDHTLEHHYRVDIFYEAINCQLMELDHRFSDSTMEMFRLASTLDPKNAHETFRSLDVCQLVEKFYPGDFSDQERTILKMQLQHYVLDVVQHADFKQLTFSTATTERSFSAMNIVKTRIRNKMEDEFLNDSLLLFIEREVAEKISLDEIVDDFKAAKDRRVPL